MAGISQINYLVYNGYEKGKVINIINREDEEGDHYKEVIIKWDKINTEITYYLYNSDVILHPKTRIGDYIKPIKIDDVTGLFIPIRFRYMNKYMIKILKEKKINDLITVRMIGNIQFSDIILLVNNKYFSQCRKVIFNIPIADVDNYDYINSIDEVIYGLKDSDAEEDIDIDIELEFFAHYSNLQAWVENNYDTRILASNLSFPLLKKLVKNGDKEARKIFKDEIAKRLETGFMPTVKFLILNKYLDFLTQDEINIIAENIEHKRLKEFFYKYDSTYKDKDEEFFYQFFDILMF